MSVKACVQCQRPLAPGELWHLHMTRFYAVGGSTFWTHFPTTRMLRLFEQWLAQTQKTQLVNDALRLLPPEVVAQERLVEATEALRVALGLPHVRSLLDLLEAVLERLGAGSREVASREAGDPSAPPTPTSPTPLSLSPCPEESP